MWYTVRMLYVHTYNTTDVCSSQDNVDLGDLMFSLCYLPTAGRLTITMIKARNLKAMDITGASGNRNATTLHNVADGNWKSPLVLLLLLRSLRESLAHVRWPQAEEKEDVDEEEHSESRL